MPINMVVLYSDQHLVNRPVFRPPIEFQIRYLDALYHGTWHLNSNSKLAYFITKEYRLKCQMSLFERMIYKTVCHDRFYKDL